MKNINKPAASKTKPLSKAMKKLTKKQLKILAGFIKSSKPNDFGTEEDLMKALK